MLKLTIEGSLKENLKRSKPSTDLAQTVDVKLKINFNLFFIELVGEYK